MKAELLNELKDIAANSYGDDTYLAAAILTLVEEKRETHEILNNILSTIEMHNATLEIIKNVLIEDRKKLYKVCKSLQDMRLTDLTDDAEENHV